MKYTNFNLVSIKRNMLSFGIFQLRNSQQLLEKKIN